MRRLFLFGFVAMVVGIGAASVPVAAQKAVSSQEQMTAARNKSWTMNAKRPQRSVSEHKWFNNGDVVRTVTSVFEYLSDDRLRTLVRTVDSERVTEYENIRIGEIRYKRNHKMPWAIAEVVEAPASYSGPIAAGENRSVRQWTSESVFLDSLSATLFEQITVTPNEKTGLEMSEMRYWFGPDGSMLREEIIMGTAFPRIVTEEIVRTYEYDPVLKIAAPIP